MERFRTWVGDSVKGIKLQAESRLFSEPPPKYTEHKSGKSPIILIPGLDEKWGVFRALADSVSLPADGYDVYTIPELGENRFDIKTSAKIIIRFLELNGLQDKQETYFAHSKGGLEVLEVLKNRREAILFGFCCPFSGSNLARYGISRPVRELTPKNVARLRSGEGNEVNGRVISVFSEYDNLIPNGCYLEGAMKNIVVPTRGHHSILDDPWAITYVHTELLLREMEKNDKK